jgi:pimeloyl-ACP methyl ester carboxylesterase
VSERLEITVDGVRLACHARRPADAPALVLLHGLGGQASTWDTVGAEFARSHRVLAIDLRGHGDSDRPGVYSFELMRDDVLGVLGQLNDPDPAWWDRLTDITAPTLVIAGGPTSHIPQDKLAEAAARLPHGTLQVIPAGHEVHANRPAEFTAAVLQFLRC